MAEPRWITIKVNAPRFDPADDAARQAGLDVVHPQVVDALAQRRLRLAPGEGYRVRLRDAPHLPAGQVEVTATCQAVPLEEPPDGDSGTGWTDVEPGTDLYGRAVRVLHPDGRDKARGIVRADPIEHPGMPGLFGLRLGLDPDDIGLDDDVRRYAQQCRKELLGADPAGHRQPDGQATLVEITIGLSKGDRIQLQATRPEESAGG